MTHATKLLKTFDFQSIRELLLSLAPSFKYRINVYVMGLTVIWIPIDKWFGLDDLAFVGLLAVFFTEVTSGIAASRIRKEVFSSLKLSRFGLKATCYMVLIFTSYTMYMSFKHHADDTAAVVFDWLHIFLVVHIVFENIISVLENVAVISGKDKSAWIKKAKDKLDGIFG
jgi:hypothetical protein